MENENKEVLVFITKVLSGVLALFGAFVFVVAFFSDRDRLTLNGTFETGFFTIVCVTIFVICLAADIADSNGEIKALKRGKETLIENRENTGHALAALQNCILEGPKNVTALEMRMKVNAIVAGLNLSVELDPEKLKEWKGKILATDTH
jgi:hypothetical protein